MNTDMLCGDDGDLLIIDGDFVIGESDQQHVGDIFLMHQGEIKEYPVMGFGAINYVKRNITDSEFKRDLKIQLEYDDYISINIDTTQGIENTIIEI